MWFIIIALIGGKLLGIIGLSIGLFIGMCIDNKISLNKERRIV